MERLTYGLVFFVRVKNKNARSIHGVGVVRVVMFNF